MPARRSARSRGGFALALALFAVVLLGSFAAIGLAAATAQLRLAADLRVAVEADLRVASVLAEQRVQADSLLAALPSGASVDFGMVAVERGWWQRSWATRHGTLVLLSAEVLLRRTDLAVVALRRATLLLGGVSADTLRVSGYRSRY